MLRRVTYSEYEKSEAVNQIQNASIPKWELVEKGEAVFHTFGINCEEFETGVGTFTTAIIELPDGTLKNLPVEQVRFIAEDIE